MTLLVATSATAQAGHERVELALEVGVVFSVPLAEVQSFSQSGAILEVEADEARGKLDMWLVRPGRATVLLILRDGRQRSYDVSSRAPP